MKDSGIPWIGMIPSDWSVRKLRTLGKFSSSGIDKLIVEGEPLLRIINYVDVYNNHMYELWNKDYMVVSAPREKIEEHQVQIGDMIFTPSSETTDDIGVSSVVMEELPNTAYSYHVLRYRSNNELELNYKKYICNNSFVAQYFSSRCNGTIRKTLPREVFKECQILLPPIPTQKRIADFLDRKCAEIDELAALQETMIAELKRYKQSVITEAVTKGLDPDVPMKDSGVEWIGEIPSHWEMKAVKYVLQRRNQKNDPIISEERLSLSIGVGITKYADKTTNLDRFKDDFTQYQLAYPDDIVLNSMNMIVGAVGKSAFMGCVSPVYYVMIPKNSIESTYYSYLLNTPRIRDVYHSLGKGIYAIERGDGRVNTCRLTVSFYDFGRSEIPVPPNQEQQQINVFLQRKCAEIDELIAIKQQKIEALKEYKKAVMFEYVTGKKEVL